MSASRKGARAGSPKSRKSAARKARGHKRGAAPDQGGAVLPASAWSSFESSPVMMHSIDKDGRLISVNQRWLEALGYRIEEVLGKPSSAFLAPESARFARDVVQPEFFRTGICSNVAYRMVRKDGREIDVLLSAVSTRDARGRIAAAHAVIVDVTPLRQAENAAAETDRRLRLALAEHAASEARLQGLLENLAAFVLTLGPAGEIRYLNRLLPGMDRQQVLGMSCFDFVLPAHRATCMAALRRVFETSAGSVLELEAGRPGREARWYEARVEPLAQQGMVTAAQVVAVDITARRRAEEALRQSEEANRRLVESIPDYIMLVGRDSAIRYLNHTSAAEGLTPAEMLGRKALDFCDEPTRELYLKALDAVFDRREPATFEGRSVNGRWYINRMVPVMGADHAVEAALAVATDVSNLKQALAELSAVERRFQVVFEGSMDALFLVDGASGRIVECNARAVELFGARDRADLVGRVGLEFHAEPPSQELLEQGRKLIEQGQPWRHEFEYRALGGRRFWGELAAHQMLLDGRTQNLVRIADITSRREAGEALRLSEARLRAAAESLPFDFWFMDEDGRYVLQNAASVEHWGPRVGKRLEDLKMPAALRASWTASNRRAFAGEVVQEETDHAFDGELRHFHKILAPVKIEGTTRGILGVNIDITALKRAEAAHKNAEEMLRLALEGGQMGLWVWDLAHNRSQWSARESELLGLTHEPREVSTDEFFGFVHPDDAQEVKRRLAESVERRRDFSAEFRIRRADGQMRWLAAAGRLYCDENTGRPLRMAGIDYDITERRRAAEALRMSEERYRILAEHAPEALVVMDLDTGLFVEANANAERLFCASRLELLKTGPVRCSPALQSDGRPSDVAAGEYIGRAVAGETPVFEWVHLDTKGREIPCEIRLVRLPAEGRRLICGSIVDISQRKALEDQLRQSQKIESIGRLAGGVAHDFNNILTSILGFADLAARALPDDSPARPYIGYARESAKRGARLTQQLLAYARKQVIQPRIVDMNELIIQAAEMLRRLIGEDINLVLRTASNLGQVKIDPGQLEQVLMNLAVNARDAMPSGGTLTITTGNTELDAEYARAQPELEPGLFVQLTVTDTGTGMAPEVQQRIFEPFFTTKPVGKGTGLGLPMCYGIVKQNGGHISVYSELGRGSTFNIFLPRIGQPEAGKTKDTPGSSAALASVGHGETVLLVEDDEMIRELVVEVLKGAGYRVLSAEDGIAALDKARAEPGKIDLVITDIVMPRLGGRDLAERLSKDRPGIRVLFSSGYTEDAIVAQGVLEGGVDFIQKPYTPSALTLRIRDILERK